MFFRCLLFVAMTSSTTFAADAEVLFDQLTSHQWTRTTHGRGFQHTITFDLKRDGIYRWNSYSDHSERNDKGTWSFDGADEASGVLHLSESGDMPFRIEKDRLILASRLRSRAVKSLSMARMTSRARRKTSDRSSASRMASG